MATLRKSGDRRSKLPKAARKSAAKAPPKRADPKPNAIKARAAKPGSGARPAGKIV